MFRTVTAVALAGLAGFAAADAAAKTTIVYTDEPSAAKILTGDRALGPEDGVFRQAPGAGKLFRDNDDPFVIAKVNGHSLAKMSTAGMVAMIKGEIDAPTTAGAGTSGLVAIDEVGNAFRDGKPRRCFKKVKVRAKTMRIACANRIKLTKNGWKLVKGKEPEPRVPGSRHPGRKLSAAMKKLAAMPYPAGGTYADRVHIYLAPAIVTLAGEGKGKNFTRSRDGVRHVRPGIQAVAPALAKAGGVWMQMYHGNRKAVNTKTWRYAAPRLARYLVRRGGSHQKVHFLMSGTRTKPAGARCGAGTTMQCTWKLAKGFKNRRYLNNGPGVWRAGTQAVEFKNEYRVYFG